MRFNQYGWVKEKGPLLYDIRNWLLTRLAGQSPIAINVRFDGPIIILSENKNGYFANCTIGPLTETEKASLGSNLIIGPTEFPNLH